MSAKASLLALVAGFVALGWFGRPAPNAAEAPLAVSSAHAHANLTVFVLRGPDVLESGNILTLQEALERGLAVVHETETVNTLAVENLSADHELFLQSGDIVKGGKQDRIIADDMLVQAKSGKVPCRANCCEQSRWKPRDGEIATKFEKSTDFAVGNDIRIANATGQQGEVWKNVEKAQQALSQNLGKPVTANASPTSLQLALEDKDLRAKVAAYERSLGGLAKAYPDAVGVVMAVNGQVIASDVYGSKELFRKAWPKLLKSAAVDAVAQMPTGAVAIAERSEAVAFLAKREAAVWESPAIEVTGTPLQPAEREALIRELRLNDLTNTDRGLDVEIQDSEQVAHSQLSEDLRTRLSGARANGIPNAPGLTASQLPNLNGRSGATRTATVNSSGTADVIGEVQRLSNPQPQRRDTDNLSEDLLNRNPSIRRTGRDDVRFRNVVNALDRQLDGGAPRPAAAAPGVVSFESRAGSQGNALIHRGQLKK
jgi:hypothetical protein